ncbi:GntR family transcriptional regulator [Sediminibacillus albus]|uniref:GntR family transcriptional regulator n=1 Tax=Sediminibacillus albus TaxID=407036 RepID=A0A1G8YLP2_9BACI|nr:GntR family transcriptional regulator [Sediminibacillus albus]SDK03666.1 GntR family transcriptional regulator [Sediminibacillus albus]
MVDKNSPLPIYYQLEEEIKQLINSEQLKPGELLPSEREYAEKHNISRMTVRQAINNLASEGLLFRQKGKGTFVAEQKFEQNLQGLTSFSEDMRARGLQPSSRLVSFAEKSADENIAAKLQVNQGEAIFQIERIRMADQSPLAAETIYTPKKIAGNMTKQDFAPSFYEYIENTRGYKIKHANQEIESALATQKEIDHLQLEPGDPVLLIERLTYLNTDEPFEYVISAYRADKYKFKLQMPR